MIGFLNFLGAIALVVGVVLWILMVRSGLANLRTEKLSAAELQRRQNPQQ